MTPTINYIRYLKRCARGTNKTILEIHQNRLARETAIMYGVDPNSEATIEAIKEATHESL